MELCEALENVIKAWDSLPGPRQYSPSEVASWLLYSMAPAIRKARKAVKEHKRGL